jgi:phage shock protein C
MRKLYKSNKDKVFSGVIGGIGEYTDIDPTILRLVYILITILTGIFPAIIAYIIASLVVPKQFVSHHIEHTEPKKEGESK